MAVNQPIDAYLPDLERVVVVGSGPAGIELAEQLCRRGWQAPVLVLGDEPFRPYDRVRLSSLLAREIAPAALYTGRRLERHANVTVLTGRRVVRIDRGAKIVQDQHGNVYPYTKLVLALGSRPRVPAIPGVELAGVYVFRNMRDVERLLARQVGSRVTAVIGGGLLGLEAAGPRGDDERPPQRVTCASCHMPRVEESYEWGAYVHVLVQHNQSDNLHPNDKMLRSVCLNCHGLGFSLDALADPGLIRNNFAGPPNVHVESIDLAERRRRAIEAER